MSLRTQLPWKSTCHENPGIFDVSREPELLLPPGGEVEAPALPPTPPTAQHDVRNRILTLHIDIDAGQGSLVLGGAAGGTAEVSSVVGCGSPEQQLAAARPGAVTAGAHLHTGIVPSHLPAHRWGSPATTTHTNYTASRKNTASPCPIVPSRDSPGFFFSAEVRVNNVGNVDFEFGLGYCFLSIYGLTSCEL